MTVFLLLTGIALLYIGSEALVRGASSLAQRLHIKPLIIGLTVIAFSTSSPELFVSIKATLIGHGNISAGDVVGANIFNVAGILAFCSLFQTLPLKKQLLKFDMPIMFGTYILLSTFLLSGAIPRWAGAIFVTLLALYLIAIYLVPKRRAFQEIEAEEEMGKPLKNIYLDLFFIGGGIASLAFGSQEIVAGAIHIAKFLGVDEASVSLSIVSVGTTLPELSCCLVALRQKKYDILVGNIIGSNIFNVLSVLGIAALVRPLEVDQIRWVDLLMMFLSAALIFPVFQKEAGFGRIKGGVLLVIYAGYLYSLTFSIWQF